MKVRNLHEFLSARELGLRRAPRRLSRGFLNALRVARIVANGVVVVSPPPDENVGYEVVLENAEVDSPSSPPSGSDGESPVTAGSPESPASPTPSTTAEAVPTVEEGSEAFVVFDSPPSSPTAFMQTSGYVLREPTSPVPLVYYGPQADTSDEDISEQ